MDLNVHKLITYNAYKKYLVVNNKQNNEDYLKSFHDLWMGNWLTDMNQATAFFSIISSLKVDDSATEIDYYDARKNGNYVLPEILNDKTLKEAWVNLINALWTEEWKEVIKEQTNFDKDIKIERGHAKTGTAESIGCYYPLDHFDVTDEFRRNKWTDNEAEELTNISVDNPWSRTAKGGIEYALNGWLKKAFNEKPSDRLNNWEALKILGHGLHVLQDFFAHSNYPEVLLIAINQECNLNKVNPVLSKNLDAQIKQNIPGTFNSFPFFNKAINTPILTGRFDTIDTIYILAGKYKNSLMQSAWNNTISVNTQQQNNEDETEKILDILFSTFSNISIVKKSAGVIKKISGIKSFFAKINLKIKKATVHLFNKVAQKKFKNDPKMANCAELLSGLTTSVLSSKTTKSSYEKAGKFMFVEHNIEQYLKIKIDEVEKNKKYALPHHTLLAKDNVVLNPEVRLAFKLGCVIATELSHKIIDAYFEGKKFTTIKTEVNKQLRHPKDRLKDVTYKKDILNKIDKLYSGRWWQYQI